MGSYVSPYDPAGPPAIVENAPGSALKNLIHEIHRRSLWQVVGIYLAGGWVALQVVEQLAEAAALPEWVRPFALVLLIIGFPIVLATAFVQEGIGARPVEAAPTALADAGEVPPPAVEPAGAAKLFTWRNAIGGGVVALALWGLVSLGWVFLGGAGPDGVAPPPAAANPAEALLPQGEQRTRSVAILPFENMSADEENAFFADGVHESMITQLSKIGDLRVLSRASMMRYRDTDLSLQEIADEVSAGAVLQGSVQRAGDRLRISAQLIDPYSDENLWAETFDGSVGDIFDFQSEVALAVADQLRATLSPMEQVAVARPATESVTALDFYLQGRVAYDAFTGPANEDAIRLFRLAIAEDSSFAEAWAGLGDGYLQRVQFHGYPIEWADSGMVAAERALTFNENLADAHKTVGFALSMLGRDDESLAAYLRAVEISPNHASATNNIGVSHARRGERDEAVRWYKLAFVLDPNNVLARLNVAFGYSSIGEFEQAARWYEQARRLTPEDPNIAWYQYFNDVLEHGGGVAGEALEAAMARMESVEPRVQYARAEAALYAGDSGTALRFAEMAESDLPEGGLIGAMTDSRVTRGWALSRDGLTGQALEVLNNAGSHFQRLLDSGADNWTTLYPMAQIEALRGNRERASDLLARAMDAGLNFPGLIEQDPTLVDIIADTRIQELIQRNARDLARQRESLAAEELASGERN
jgi:TolB-like protein